MSTRIGRIAHLMTPPMSAWQGTQWEYENFIIPLNQLTPALNARGKEGWEAWAVLETSTVNGVDVLGIAFRRLKSRIVIAGQPPERG